MSDRDLLEMAAKAAGYEVRHDGEGGLTVSTGAGRCKDWNPLTDDGDALRLAVKLRLHVDHHKSDVDAWVVSHVSHKYKASRFEESNNDDPLAATRRAIVRAAAEIGRAML